MIKSELKDLLYDRYYSIGKQYFINSGGKSFPALVTSNERLEIFRLFDASKIDYNIYKDVNDFSIHKEVHNVIVYIDDLGALVLTILDSTKPKRSLYLPFVDYVIVKALYRTVEIENLQLNKIRDSIEELLKSQFETNMRVIEILYRLSPTRTYTNIVNNIDKVALNGYDDYPILDEFISDRDVYTLSVLNKVRYDITIDPSKFYINSEGLCIDKFSGNIKLNPII